MKLWNEFIEKALKHEDYLKFMDEANRWLKETKSPVNLDGRYYAQAPSPYLNIYNYPKGRQFGFVTHNLLATYTVKTEHFLFLFEKNLTTRKWMETGCA